MPADIFGWIAQLKSNQWLLDVGSGAGSFPGADFSCAWLALDDDPAAFTTTVGYSRVVGASHRLPVRDGSIDLVICHHALEHLTHLDETLTEMARVLKPGARCYLSFPNGYGLCDAVYRYLFEGGGHVNRFRRNEVVSLIEERLNVRLVGWQKLYSSFVYLCKLMEFLDAPPPNLSGRLSTVGKLPRGVIAFVQRTLYTGTRFLDRWLLTDLSVYGWAFFFERSATAIAIEQPGYLNVCPYCGTGQPAATAPRTGWWTCRCQNCSRTYPYTRPFRNTQ
jgi:predicted SAM-dependent methyltransferase